MKFKKELKALKEKINKVIGYVKEAQVEVCRRDSCNILPDFSKEKKGFLLNDYHYALFPSFFFCLQQLLRK
ncbi:MULTISPECIES: hypothetical protein [unclassified Bartonella]|uniref:hypothetical protein n=1 Tax=unclassified Bartonella TaxID=2645622 RepID=UPI0035CFCDDB